MSDTSPGRSPSDPEVDSFAPNRSSKPPNSPTREPANEHSNLDSDPDVQKHYQEGDTHHQIAQADPGMELDDPPAGQSSLEYSANQSKDSTIEDELQFSDDEPDFGESERPESDKDDAQGEGSAPELKLEPADEADSAEATPGHTHLVKEERMTDSGGEGDGRGRDDKELVGLFEDSDEYETLEEKPKPQFQQAESREEQLEPPREEVQEVINTTLNLIPKPAPGDALVVCRFPPTFVVSTQSDIRAFLRANPYLLEHPPTSSNLSYLYFKHAPERPDGQPLGGPPGAAQGADGGWSSNGRFVLWEDGSVTLFIGKVPLDCEFRPEISFLVEDSRAELKPVHAQVNLRLQTRFSNLLKNDLIKKKPKPKRQRMEVTSISEAIQSHHTLRQNAMNLRESERNRRSTHGSRGLTRSFLESSDEDDMP